jgi:hypothetical protein
MVRFHQMAGIQHGAIRHDRQQRAGHDLIHQGKRRIHSFGKPLPNQVSLSHDPRLAGHPTLRISRLYQQGTKAFLSHTLSGLHDRSLGWDNFQVSVHEIPDRTSQPFSHRRSLSL